MPSSTAHAIRLRNVRQNNLKGFDLDVPIGQLSVVTGLSGAGKSSLVFETLHAEGQRRYVETFSPYTRQFLDLLDRPKVDQVENIRPSIAVEQTNSVKTSRSTVGTLTELCDYFKVWFSKAATLIDPASGQPLVDDNAQSVWRTLSKTRAGETIILSFPVHRPKALEWEEIFEALQGQGYTRCLVGDVVCKIADRPKIKRGQHLSVVQDRLKISDTNRPRFIEAAETCFRLGHGTLAIHDKDGATLEQFRSGLVSPVDGGTYRAATPALFSFNSPIGACPTCRGFGRVIEIDDHLIIPDERLSVDDGAIRAFSGAVYSESLRDLQRAARRARVSTDVPWSEMTAADRSFVMDGDPDYDDRTEIGWYGVRRFFKWLEGKAYKMHVRVFLSKFRSYKICPTCNGARLQPESLLWQWEGLTLPQLYQMPVNALIQRIQKNTTFKKKPESEPALQGILTRLSFLEQVGLGYLSLDRSSRTLSGGEMMRVSLTSCLGASLVDTLFVLDEPSVGLHARDLDRLIGILRRLTDTGNTVVVVEHDEALMRAADHFIEIGPEPGRNGGQLIHSGPPSTLAGADTPTTRFLNGTETIALPKRRRSTAKRGKDAPQRLSIRGASHNNIRKLDCDIPLQRLVAISGVSGSGKSTFINNILYQNLLIEKGLSATEPAQIGELTMGAPLGDVVFIDQSPVSKTPRSNAAVFTGAWDGIRKLFAATDAAKSNGLTPSHFSFNSGDGRCETCAGLGYERIEMQFISDVFVPCPSCSGKRFKPEILAITWNGYSVADMLDLEIQDAVRVFAKERKIIQRLEPLLDVGLGYLTLGQPLNTLSGGESQRLKLVRYLGRLAENAGRALILIDESTTGLHRADVKRLIGVLQELVDAGHSVIVIEHNLDVLKCADHLIEFGPGAGIKGGQIVFTGTPEQLATAKTETAPYIAAALDDKAEPLALVAESSVESYSRTSRPDALEVIGAREHNLRDVSVRIPHNTINVVTGVSGSGKSSLAFDIIFAEGQRRFMDSMSAYARQFVEQLPRPDVDAVNGIAPTIAIEQRVTHGTRKSTVATITEVAQYLRLLYARIGIQFSPTSGEPVISQEPDALFKRLGKILKAENAKHIYLCAELVRGRKGHHEPIANWARDHGYELLRIDGKIIPVAQFKKLDRYREHDIAVVVADLGSQGDGRKLKPIELRELLKRALQLGKGTAFVLRPSGTIASWLSTERTDPVTGEAFPALDPKHFSWNSAKGWCPTCRGYGQLFDWMEEREDWIEVDEVECDGATCPDCNGGRLNRISANVRLPRTGRHEPIALPELLSLRPAELLDCIATIATDERSAPVLAELQPEIEERLRFMTRVGLGYLTLDRSTATLSGGEAQRIRLAAQLGSNLSGVLYVLDEPSIGLHARDNAKLIASLETLRDRGNTLVVVEHDEATMEHADCIFDLGPRAGVHGGELVAQGTIAELRKAEGSLTGRYLREPMPHPLRGAHRRLPKSWSPRGKAKQTPEWLVLRKAALRNLRGFDLTLPLQRLSVICGVSGAGKSTLARDLLRPLVAEAQSRNKALLTSKDLKGGKDLLPFQSLHNGNAIRKVIEVDQSPIGKTPRSTPATYIGAFDTIRLFFASLPEARARGYTASTFSFNTKGGRCETCKGAGRVKLEMEFMPNTYVDCEDCGGCRYAAELLDLRWNGKNIAEVLDMTFDEAARFFDFHSGLKAQLELMVETGLGYLRLGQSSPTLSGGEAQRLKLVSELAKGLPTFTERNYGTQGGNLYILEEPTIGLHLSDCERLIELLHRLVDQGHTVLVIEHHLDVIADADYLVEIGPDGGDGGGDLLFAGSVAECLQCKPSVTAPFLKAHLRARS